MQTYTISDLNDYGAQVLKNAEASKLAVVTDQGRPIFVAVPFDDLLLDKGIRLALAVRLFDEEALSTGQAARFASVSLAEFMETCSGLGVPLVRYPPEEFEKELETIDELRRC